MELNGELLKITQKYKHPCDNYILMTNVCLTPVFQKGIKDKIENEIIPKYRHAMKHIDVLGSDEICRFLDNYPGIRQTYAHLVVPGDIIASLAKKIESKQIDLDALVQLYSEECYKQEQCAVLDDAGDVEDKPVTLQQVFIDLEINAPTLPQDPKLLERFPHWLKQAAEDEKRTSALSYLLDDSIAGVVLIGGPGEGKSTLGQYVAQIHRARLTGRLKELGENAQEFEKCTLRLSFRVLLKEYAQWITTCDDSGSLFHFIAYRITRDALRDTEPEEVRTIVETNPILLVLDGLDEVPGKELRKRVLNNITSFVRQIREGLKGDIRVIATTRPYGYSEEFDPANYLHLVLQKLSSAKALAYANRWIDSREPNPREIERIRGTFDVCLKDRVVNVLTQTPLQVTILLVIIRARGTPPKQREELFERYMDIIYQREQKKRPELLRTEQDIIYGLHRYLAYILHRRAEKDKTAALMDVLEFKEKVKEYLTHSNPLLSETELNVKVDEIITEASQRLVLIESPQEGKVGFGLTTTREFFAAAHLVDTAKDTKERDLRFGAIIRSPYWRNVALFFAGRVGRTRPGEAPSMIDVCREIDIERADRFLRRGAGLVLEMVDDRVLRQPHNEIGAIQYGLTLFDNTLIRQGDEVVNELKNLPDEYKERVIRPWMKERLKNVALENLELYVDAYEKIFYVDEPLRSAMQRAAESDSEKMKLWALSEVFKHQLVESWGIKLFEELVGVVPYKTMSWTLEPYWANLGSYFRFSLSSKASMALATAFLLGCQRYMSTSEPEFSKSIQRLSSVKPEENRETNSLLFWAVCQLAVWYHLAPSRIGYKAKDWLVQVSLPRIANQKVIALLTKNSNLVRSFCEVFSKENQPFTNFLIALFEFLNEPSNLKKYIKISEALHENREIEPRLRSIISNIFDLPVEKELSICHRDLYTVSEYYKSQEQFEKELEELNELINKKSEKIKNHPAKLYYWIDFHRNETIKKFLDSEILTELNNWFDCRGISLRSLRPTYRQLLNDLELCEMILDTTATQLAKEERRIAFDLPLVLYKWHDPKTEQELKTASKLKYIFEDFLAKYYTLIDPKYDSLSILYWASFSADIIEDKHISKLYSMVHNISRFPLHSWFIDRDKRVKSTLVNMLRNDNLEVVRLAAVSLSAISQERTFFYEREEIKEAWVGDKYWELANDKLDIWRPRYIEGMAQCRLKWAEKGEEWLTMIQQSDNEELVNAWRLVISEAGFCEANDQQAFFDVLLSILESRDTFSDSIRRAAFRRLSEIVYAMEPVGFDEILLNLPLSKREGVQFK